MRFGLNSPVPARVVEKVKEMLVADPGLAKQQCLDIGDFWLNGTPLHWASSSGQEEVVDYLLAHEVDVNAKAVNTLYTPLHSAAGFGRRDVAELLLASKAAVDSRDKDRNTPLHLAAGNWPTEVIELLLANRPKIYEKDKEGKTQLQVMQAWDARDVIELLLANRAEVNARNKLGRTPLHMAAEFGNKGVIELLLSHKADVDAKDKKGRTPLRIAVVEQPDEITVQESPDGGRSASVRHRFKGRLSRASLVYELNGTEQTAEEASGYQRELQGGGKIREEAEATVVELSGQVPEGACRVNLLIQDELGTHALPIPLQ